MKILHNSKYITYYPIKTKSEFDRFLHNELTWISRTINVERRMLFNNIIEIEGSYIKHFKKETSLKKHFHNVKVKRDMENDYRIGKGKKYLSEINDIQQRFEFHNLTIDDANIILKTAENVHKRIIVYFMAFIAIIILLLLFM